MENHLSEQEYLLHSVVVNEIISGQPKAYFDWRVAHGLLSPFDFSRYHLLITGLHREIYRAHFHIDAQAYGFQFGCVQKEIESLLDAQNIPHLSTMLLYDHSKRFCLIFQSVPGISAMDIAQIVSGCFNRMYAQIFDMSRIPYRNYTVLSDEICGYDALTDAFQEMDELSRQQFFDMQTTVMTPQQFCASRVKPDTEKIHEDRRQLSMAIQAKDTPAAQMHYRSIMEYLKKARDFTLLRSELHALREILVGLLKSHGLGGEQLGMDGDSLTQRQYATFELMQEGVWQKIALCMDAHRSGAPLSVPMQEAIRFIRHHYAESISLTDAAAYVGMSSSWLSRHFVLECGCSMTAYLQRIRVEQACLLLRDTDRSIVSIAGRIGIENAQYFSAVFKKTTGMTPSEYRDMHRKNDEMA